MKFITDHDFGLWAFGGVYYSYLTGDACSFDLLQAWNWRHSDILTLRSDSSVHEDMGTMQYLYKQWSNEVDKKMHKVTREMKSADKDIVKRPKVASAKLKKAEKKNEKLVKEDRDVRDPMIDKCKKQMKGKKK